MTVAFAAFLPRVFFIFYAPETGGDWDIYSTVAENILSGCGVSLSAPESGECIPHFGGNQGPGYPAFVALIWWLSGHSDIVVRVIQVMLSVVAIMYMVRSVFFYSSSFKAAVLVGFVLALSPLEIAWPRYLQTETLALAGTLWVFSELLMSLYESRIRIFPLSIALIVTTFIRLDAILLVAPIAVTAFMIYKPFQAIKKGLIIAILLSLPWGAWLVRNHMVGMTNILPLPMTSPNNAASPNGYLKWLWTWSTHEYQRPGTLFPVTRFVYDAIEIDPSIFSTLDEEKKVYSILDELKKYQGKPFPKYIDNKFNNQYIPEAIKNNDNITVGLSYVYGAWTTNDILYRIKKTIDDWGLSYCRMLTDCNLTRDSQLHEHEKLSDKLYKLGYIDKNGKLLTKIFHQLKYHGTKKEANSLWVDGQCYLQIYNVFWDTTGHDDNSLSSCYTCDSITVLSEEDDFGINTSERKFNSEKWGTVSNNHVEDLFKKPVRPYFNPKIVCRSCLFMRNNRIAKELINTKDYSLLEIDDNISHVNFP